MCCPALAEGGAQRPPAPTARMSCALRLPLRRAGAQCRPGGRSVRKSAAAMLLTPRIGQQFGCRRDGCPRRRDLVRIMSPLAEGAWWAEGLDVGDRARVQLLHTDVQRELHRLCACTRSALSRGATPASDPRVFSAWPCRHCRRCCRDNSDRRATPIAGCAPLRARVMGA